MLFVSYGVPLEKRWAKTTYQCDSKACSLFAPRSNFAPFTPSRKQE